MGARRGRWYDLKKAAEDSNLLASDKAVFGLLLSKADCRTGEVPAPGKTVRPFAHLTGGSESAYR